MVLHQVIMERLSLNPWDGREGHGVNLTPGVAERAPNSDRSVPQRWRNGSEASGTGGHSREGTVPLVPEQPCINPKTRYNPSQGSSGITERHPEGPGGTGRPRSQMN